MHLISPALIASITARLNDGPMIMNWKERINATLARFGYNFVRLPRPWHQLQGRDWVADAKRLIGSCESMVLMDVGANTGQTCLTLARAFPRAKIFSFEPFPEAFTALEANTRGFSNLTPINAALGANAGELNLHVNANHQTNSFLPATSCSARWLPENLIRNINSIKVPVLTLDEFCTARDIESINVLKIDTQGYELQVLQGARRMLERQRVGLVYVEVQFAPLYDGQPSFIEVYDLLEQHNLTFVGFYGASYSEHNRLLWADALFAADMAGKESAFRAVANPLRPG